MDDRSGGEKSRFEMRKCAALAENFSDHENQQPMEITRVKYCRQVHIIEFYRISVIMLRIIILRMILEKLMVLWNTFNSQLATQKNILAKQRKFWALDISLAKEKKYKSHGKCQLDLPLRSTIYGTSSLWIRADVIGGSILKRSLILTRLFPLESAEEKYVPPGSYLQCG